MSGTYKLELPNGVALLADTEQEIFRKARDEMRRNPSIRGIHIWRLVGAVKTSDQLIEERI